MKLTVLSGAIGGLIILAITPFVLNHATLTPDAMGYQALFKWQMASQYYQRASI